MKKVVLFLCASLIFVACSNEEYISMSNSIKESKDKKVFICEYSLELQIPDSLKFEAREIWLEKRWKSKNFNNHINIGDNYQLILLTKKGICKKTDYSFSWYIGNIPQGLFRSCGDDCFMTNIDSIPFNFKYWNIYLGDETYVKTGTNVIGKLKLNRKN